METAKQRMQREIAERDAKLAGRSRRSIENIGKIRDVSHLTNIDIPEPRKVKKAKQKPSGQRKYVTKTKRGNNLEDAMTGRRARFDKAIDG